MTKKCSCNAEECKDFQFTAMKGSNWMFCNTHDASNKHFDCGTMLSQLCIKETTMPNKEYLGDSVYVEFDGFGLTLTTNNGYPDDPRNEIYLEPKIVENMIKYFDKIKEIIKEKNNA